MTIITDADVATFKTKRIVTAAATYFPDVELDDDYLKSMLWAGEADVARQLRVRLEPTTFFSHDPTQAEIDALGAMPWEAEPGYDYDADFFRSERWGYIVTRQKPLISVQSIKLIYPSVEQSIYQIPASWIRVDHKYGQIRLVPGNGTINAPLGIFVMQVLGGGASVPGMVQVQYVAGIQNVRDPKWADLLDLVFKVAIQKVIGDRYLPASASISGDGLSQSISYDPEKASDAIDRIMFGPKGSNGGLFTSIHGVVSTVGGVMA